MLEPFSRRGFSYSIPLWSLWILWAMAWSIPWLQTWSSSWFSKQSWAFDWCGFGLRIESGQYLDLLSTLDHSLNPDGITEEKTKILTKEGTGRVHWGCSHFCFFQTIRSHSKHHDESHRSGKKTWTWFLMEHFLFYCLFPFMFMHQLFCVFRWVWLQIRAQYWAKNLVSSVPLALLFPLIQWYYFAKLWSIFDTNFKSL